MTSSPESTSVGGRGRGGEVSVIILAHNRRRSVERSLRLLEGMQVEEVIVVDNASTDGTAEMVRAHGGRAKVVRSTENVGVAGRNLGAQAARGEFLLLLDDDSHPCPGAVEALREAFEGQPRLGVVGGFIRDQDREGRPLPDGAVGTFDWWLRAGASGDPPREGFPSPHFPECGCLIRREAYFDAGGFFEPYFFHISEPDFAIRLLTSGWDVRYLPTARFEHVKEPRSEEYLGRNLRFRVRNQLWYCWRHYPLDIALRRMLVFALLDLIECVWLGATRWWLAGVAAAWRERDAVRGTRAPIPRALVPRAELGRGRMQLAFMLWMFRRKVLSPLLPAKRRTAG